MINHLPYFKNPDESKINFDIMTRSFEQPLDFYVVQCFKSISNVLPEVKMTHHEFVVDVDEIDQKNYERLRTNSKTVINKNRAQILDSHVGEIRMNFHVDLPRPVKIKNKKTKEEVTLTNIKPSIKMLIPLQDENGYSYIKGKRYIMQLQMSETSTYLTSSYLSLKSLLPIKIQRKKIEVKVDDQIFILPVFEVFVFRKYENALYFYFANMGWENTLEYFGIGEYIRAIPTKDYLKSNDKYLYIKINSSISLRVDKNAFFNSQYIKSMVGTICSSMTNRMTYEDGDDCIFNRKLWFEKIGVSYKINASKENRYGLGVKSTILFNRMLDEATKNSLRIEDVNKQDIYAIIRWLCFNYEKLRCKDNFDLLNKRFRGNECIAASLNTLISNKIKSFVNSDNDSLTDEKLLAKYNDLFSYKGYELINRLHSSGLLRFADDVNDIDFFNKLRYTSKGINSMGGKPGSRTVSSAYRTIHPSHLGRVEINYCSSSDPGMTGFITPMVETDGPFFKGANKDAEDGFYQLKLSVGELDNSIIEVVDANKFSNLLDMSDITIHPNVKEDN